MERTAEHLAQFAVTLLDLHRPGDPVVLPTVWDAWSANLAVDAGFAALTAGSHPVADSVGKDVRCQAWVSTRRRIRRLVDQPSRRKSTAN